MVLLKFADVIIADFPGVTGIKRRPAVVISTADYHTTVWRRDSWSSNNEFNHCNHTHRSRNCELDRSRAT